ncbi:acyltransferase family protein [Conexibacter arvalis]|uniref:Peptidoglycan/LPS O-acetylase OafA/YrhL n=1 Tax=Conexibacter arvalis TaxID=912552 RepID=A0A840IDE3_9ACTN|nr:acyltransferase [Conexibacter arvalis]MBB4662967.1 peptidoglycan/LPS O-acetylase OafA/YrhL [Conexibacter arvalis]
MTHKSPTSPSRSDAIDGLRGLAALTVLVFHGWLYTRVDVSAGSRASVVDYALHEGRLGLVLFFVLSGFLLWRPWVAAGRGRRDRPGTAAYLVHRGARVLPGYYLALAGSIALLWGAAGTPGVRLPDADLLPLFLVFAQNFNPGSVMKLDPPMWTLAVEVSFYLLLPLLALLVSLRLPRRRAAQALVPLALLAVGVVYNHAIAGGGSIVAGKVLPAMLPYFALGMLAAVALDGRPRFGPRVVWPLLLGGCLLVVADAVWQAHGAASESGSYSYRIWRDLPGAAGFALIVVAAAGGDGTGTAALRWRPLVAFGTISYGVYLWHVPLLLYARHLGVLPLQTVPGTLVALLLTVPVAAASWRWVERPAIERGRALTRRRAGRGTTPATASISSRWRPKALTRTGSGG